MRAIERPNRKYPYSNPRTTPAAPVLDSLDNPSNPSGRSRRARPTTRRPDTAPSRTSTEKPLAKPHPNRRNLPNRENVTAAKTTADRDPRKDSRRGQEGNEVPERARMNQRPTPSILSALAEMFAHRRMAQET
jgi:hypothetical protein